jgi:hypothetical protein
MSGLMGMIMGSGWVNLHRVGFGLTGRVLAPLRDARPRVHWATARAGWAT